MKIEHLSLEHQVNTFDCGDSDLNDFLQNDAILFFEKRIASTYVLEDNGQIIAYFSLLNDKVSKLDATGSSWKRLKKLFPHSKHFSSYPAIKIGRLAVDKKYEGKGVGRKLMNRIKEDLRETSKASAFRFLTVDAYLSAVPFYEKNGFKMLLNNDENKQHKGYVLRYVRIVDSIEIYKNAFRDASIMEASRSCLSLLVTEVQLYIN